MQFPRWRGAPELGILVVTFLPILGLGGCSQDDAEIPALAGPSGLGLSIDLDAVPSILNADGVSTSVITAVVRNYNSTPVSGQQLFFQHDGDGVLIASAGVVGGLQTGVSLVTDGNGVAQLSYRAGTEPGRVVFITCQPYSSRAGAFGEPLRFVVIDQR